MQNPFERADVHGEGQAGEFLVAPLRNLDIDWRSDFPPELRIFLGNYMRQLRGLAIERQDGQQTFLTQAILGEFDRVIHDPNMSEIEFPQIVFAGILRTVEQATEVPDDSPIAHRDMQEGLVWMLLNAGAQGIGAATNLTGRYLRIARHNNHYPRQQREFTTVDDNTFIKGHIALHSPDGMWHERGFFDDEEFQQALQADDVSSLFIMRCLGELFVRACEGSVQTAAEVIATRGDLEDIIARYPTILGPLNDTNIFKDRYRILEEMSRFVRTIAEEIGLDIEFTNEPLTEESE